MPDDAFGRHTLHTPGANGIWGDGDDVNTPQAASAVGNPCLFTGRRYDPETGLYDYRARMYHPALGRFMQPDPIGYYDSMNLYQYCGNDPVNWVDPWGLEEEKRSWWRKFCDWFWGNAPQEIAEEAVERTLEKVYVVDDGAPGTTGESLQVAVKEGLIDAEDAADSIGFRGIKKCKEEYAEKVAKEKAEKAARKAAERLRKQGQREYNKGGAFTDYFHKHYKNKHKIPGGKGVRNPDMDLGPAYKEWLELGKPDWR